MTRILPGFALLALALVPFACGGESSSDGSGGAQSGGSGGAPGGGAPGGGSGGGSGGIPAGGSGGSGACGPMPTGDCIVCGHYASMICQNGAWTCPPENCVDAGTCPSGQVPTVEGCLSCSDASSKLDAAIEAARKANAACGTAGDCVLTASGTACAGACQVAVSASGEAAFKALLSKLDGDYCSGFVPVCGYSTPKCAVPTLECNAGSCEAKFN